MIITRTPFRITLGGGGTDLPGYYKKHGGFVLSAALNKYMFIYLNTPIVDDLVRIKYSKSETVEEVSELQHTLCREALRLFGIRRAIEVISMADVPAGTGLGSSSCYLVGLLNALHTLEPPADVAPAVGRGGLSYRAGRAGQADRQAGSIPGGVRRNHGACISRATGRWMSSRSSRARSALKIWKAAFCCSTPASRARPRKFSPASHRICSATTPQWRRIIRASRKSASRFYAHLKRGNVRRFGEMLDEHWQAKKQLGSGIANPRIDRLYEIARANGALGGKISGAGGGGLLPVLRGGRQEGIAPRDAGGRAARNALPRGL